MYCEVVHAVWANAHLHGRGITHAAIAFSWLAGAIVAVTVTARTTGVVDDVCYTLVLWNSLTSTTCTPTPLKPRQHGALQILYCTVCHIPVTLFAVLRRRRWSYRPHDAPRWVIEPSR